MSNNPKILIVDDRKDMIFALTNALKMQGYRIISADNGLTAIELVRKEQPDAAIMDIRMPEMDGLELISNVQSFNASMKTIATTTHIRNEKQFQGIAPFVHVIKKPYKNLDNLRELLLIFLEQQSILEDVEKNEQQGVFVWDL